MSECQCHRKGVFYRRSDLIFKSCVEKPTKEEAEISHFLVTVVSKEQIACAHKRLSFNTDKGRNQLLELIRFTLLCEPALAQVCVFFRRFDFGLKKALSNRYNRSRDFSLD